MRLVAAAIASLALGLALAASAQADPAVSVKVFPTSAPALKDDFGTYEFGWKVVAEIRGLPSCDSWALTGSGSGGSRVVLGGGPHQETGEFKGTVQPGRFAEIGATARCTVGTTSYDGTAESTFVDGPPAPTTSNDQPVAPQRFLSTAAEADLRRAAGTFTSTALIACRAAAQPKRIRGAKALAPLLGPLCATSLESAVGAAMPAAAFSDESSGIALPQLPAKVPAATIKKLCKALSRKRRKQCNPLRKSVAAFIDASRAVAGTSTALRQTGAAFRSSSDFTSGALLQAGTGRAYAGILADGYVFQQALAADLLKRLKAAGLKLSLPRKEARRAGRDFESGKGVPVNAQQLLGESAENKAAVAGLLLQLRDAVGGRSYDIRKTLAAKLPRDGLLSASGEVTLPMLLEILQRVRDSSDDSGSGESEIERHVRRLGFLCDPAARAAEVQAIVAFAQTTTGQYAPVVRRAAAPLAGQPAPRGPGCPEPLGPQPGIFRAIGGFGTGPGQFDRPTDVTVGPGGVYVADQNNSRVQRFAPDGTFLGQWGTRPAGTALPADGQFIEAVSVATDTAGNVFVGDFHGDRIQKFTADGTFITKFGSTGTGDGQFTRVGGIATDPSGNVYAVDPGGGRVQKFTGTGAFVTKFGTTGTGPGQFRAPRGITVAPNGEVYVAERDNGRIQVYDSNGAFLREWGQRGLENGQFNGAYDVAIDPDGNVWTADLFGYRLQKFTPTGQLLGITEQFGPNREPFNPFAVAVDSNFNIWVADIYGGSGDRVLMFGSLR